MTTLQFPDFEGETKLSFRLDLEDREFEFSFHNNSRDGFWYMDIADTNENPLRTGIKMVEAWDLNKFLNDVETDPLGMILVVDTLGRDAEATIDNLGGDLLLFYEESS